EIGSIESESRPSQAITQGGGSGMRGVAFRRRICRALSGFEIVVTQGAAGENRNVGSQPATRHFHCEKIYQPRPLISRSHPGRQHGADESGREIRVPPWL